MERLWPERHKDSGAPVRSKFLGYQEYLLLGCRHRADRHCLKTCTNCLWVRRSYAMNGCTKVTLNVGQLLLQDSELLDFVEIGIRRGRL